LVLEIFKVTVVCYERFCVDYQRFPVDYQRFNKKWRHPALMDVLNHLAFRFWKSLKWLLNAMSGFVSTISAFLSTISAKDVAIGGFLSTISGSLSSISGSSKNGDIQLWWMSLTI